jgi:hypothetical protein
MYLNENNQYLMYIISMDRYSLRTRLSGTFPIWVPCADSLGYNQPLNQTYAHQSKTLEISTVYHTAAHYISHPACLLHAIVQYILL